MEYSQSTTNTFSWEKLAQEVISNLFLSLLIKCNDRMKAWFSCIRSGKVSFGCSDSCISGVPSCGLLLTFFLWCCLGSSLSITCQCCKTNCIALGPNTCFLQCKSSYTLISSLYIDIRPWSKAFLVPWYVFSDFLPRVIVLGEFYLFIRSFAHFLALIHILKILTIWFLHQFCTASQIPPYTLISADFLVRSSAAVHVIDGGVCFKTAWQ